MLGTETIGAITTSQNRLDIKIHRGKAAEVLFCDSRFISLWEDLFSKCWSVTLFQSPEFLVPWFKLYHAVNEPLVIEALVGGQTVGLNFFAITANGVIVPAADHETEYFGWICSREIAAQFVTKTFKALSQISDVCVVRFAYIDRVSRDILEECSQELIFETDVAYKPIINLRQKPSFLQKSSNRRRFRKLQVFGKVELKRMGKRELRQAFEIIDARQQRHKHYEAFAVSEPRRLFYSHLLEIGALVPTTLSVAGEVISAHLDVLWLPDRVAYLGPIGHVEAWSEFSPGKWHVHLLCELLATMGIDNLDLTPEGRYKDRFINHVEEVFAVSISLR